MTSTSNTIALASSTTGHFGTDRSVSIGRTNQPSLFTVLMGTVRIRLGGKKVAEQFATILACDVRSAARYLAGDRTPGGDETIAILIDPVIGPPALALLFDRARQTLSPADYERFARVMAEAALRAFVREGSDG